MRCPRCKLEIGARPEGGAAGAARPAGREPSFCPSCGAPLRLAEEPAPRPLDGPVSLDRRGAPLDLDATLTGGVPRRVASPRPAERVSPPTRRSELADVERSHWELGKALGAVTRPPARPGATPRGAGPETWPGPGTGSARPAAPPPPIGEGAAIAPRSPAPPPIPKRREPGPPPLPAREAPPHAGESELPDAETGPVEIRVRRAEAWRRATAWAVDGLPFAVAGVTALRWAIREAAVPASPGLEGLLDLAATDQAIVLSVATAVALALAVYATLAHFLAGATLGKRVLGIRVVGPDGARPSLGRSAARSAVAIASAGILGLGFLLALFTRSGRALHDFVARTWVVRTP